MAFPAGTAEKPSTETASGDEAINSLLGADLAIETETATEEDTSAADRGTTVEDETETGVEETEVEPTEEETETEESSEEEPTEEETGEEEFNVADLETDFAESAYKKAAEHYSKTFGLTVDPNDPKDRAFLKETMLRGRKISELQAGREETEEEPEETTATETETEKPPVFKTQEEYFAHQIKNAVEYAKTNVNPVVLKEAIYPMMGAMAKFFWGDKAQAFLAGKKPEDVMELAQAMDAVMTLKGQEIAGGILANVGKQVEATYPFFSKSQDLAEKEEALDQILGDPAYTGFDKLVDSGAINRALASPELKDAVFHKDGFKNRVAKLKFAFKLARNERVDPKMLAEASKRGREAERTRSARVAAGRTPPGSSNRGTAGASGDKFITSLVANGSSRAARLFRDVGRQKQ